MLVCLMTALHSQHSDVKRACWCLRKLADLLLWARAVPGDEDVVCVLRLILAFEIAFILHNGGTYLPGKYHQDLGECCKIPQDLCSLNISSEKT